MLYRLLYGSSTLLSKSTLESIDPYFCVYLNGKKGTRVAIAAMKATITHEATMETILEHVHNNTIIDPMKVP